LVEVPYSLIESSLYIPFIHVCKNVYVWHVTRPSEQAKSMLFMVIRGLGAGQCSADLELQRHMIAERRREKLNLYQIQCIVLL